MKQYLYLITLFIAPFLLQAQEGFIQIYETGYSNTFHNISIDNDTLLCLGRAIDTTTLKWGISFTKMDTTGQVFFQKTYLDSDGNDIFLTKNSSIIKTLDGGYVVCGHDYTHAYFFKINYQGEVDVFKSYEYDVLVFFQKKIIETVDGYLLCATKQKNDYSHEVYIKKIDKQGNEMWEQEYGASGIDDRMNSFLKVDDNTYVIGYGEDEVDGNWYKARITAIDSLGEIKWEWASDVTDDFLNLWGLNPTEDGGWIFICNNRIHNGGGSPAYSFNYRAVKLNESREIEWTTLITEYTNTEKQMIDLIPSTDGSFVGVRNNSHEINEGYALSAGTFKISSQGDSLWSRLDTVIWNGSGSSAWGEAYHTGIVSLPSGSTISSGYTTYVNGQDARSFAFLIKLDKNGCITPGCNPTVDAVDWAQVASFKLYPNPASDWLKIEGEGIFDVEIYDMNGRLLVKKQRQQGVADFSVSEWPNGQYAVRIRLGEYVVVNKMLVKGN